MEVKERLQKVFSDTFRLKNVSDIDRLEPDEIPEWDSLGHEYLMTKVAEEFKIEISTEASSNLTNFREILDYIGKQQVQ